jgi:hypothetical protein
MNNDAVGLLDTPKFDTFYRVFKRAFENKRSSKPSGLLPFGASLENLLLIYLPSVRELNTI